MLLGLSIDAFINLHVVIAFAGIVTGLVWLLFAVAGRWRPFWNGAFLATTIATSITGFMFPISVFTPALGVGGLSLAVLVVALVALRRRRHHRGWAATYLVAATSALYLNVFVAVVQAFLKLPALNALAPTGTEAPFAVAQGLVLAAFILLGFLAVRHRLPSMRSVAGT